MNADNQLTEYKESNYNEFIIFDEIDLIPIVKLFHRILIHENMNLDDFDIDN